jgi:hypothetical protein
MWRMLVAFACIVIALAVIQSQVSALLMAPDQSGAAPARTWMLLPLPANPKPDPQAQARAKAEKKSLEQAALLRPFAKPHPFEAAQEGYKVTFPGKPTTPPYHVITREGTTWSYEEERLGRLLFVVTWDKKQKFMPGQTDRELLDWSKKHYQKEMQRLHGDDRRWFEKHGYFKFQNQHEAAVVIDYYHIKTDDDYYGQQMCRRWFILVGEDLYSLTVEGNADIVRSKLADDFFNSFELRPKVAKGK